MKCFGSRGNSFVRSKANLESRITVYVTQVDLESALESKMGGNY